MAQKYMGAKALKKQIAKDAAKRERNKRGKGDLFANQGETIKSKAKGLAESRSTVDMDGDFEIAEKEADKNPEYTMATEQLRRNPWFMLTYDERLIGEDLMAESETDEEADKT